MCTRPANARWPSPGLRFNAERLHLYEDAIDLTLPSHFILDKELMCSLQQSICLFFVSWLYLVTSMLPFLAPAVEPRDHVEEAINVARNKVPSNNPKIAILNPRRIGFDLLQISDLRS